MKNSESPAYPWGEHGAVLGGLTKRELIAAMLNAPDDLSVAFGEIVVGPYPSRDENGQAKLDREGILWWAKAEAIYRVIYADALLAELEKSE